MPPRTLFAAPVLAAAAAAFSTCASAQQVLPAGDRTLAHDIFKQLIEINTTDSVGNVTTAAKAMQSRLLAAGFAAADVQVLGPNDRKGNLVARYRGRPGSTLKPILIIGHLDVVEAKRADWTTDPFVFTEKDGFFYGRGTQDMKDSGAAAVAGFIRLRREGFVPNRDIILALTADEEGGQSNGVDWLLKNHRDLIDAAFALNPDSGGLETVAGKPVFLAVESSEKLYADFRITATNRGGHSSVPRADNAIYELAKALLRLEQTPFPVELNGATRAQLTAMETMTPAATTADLKAILARAPDPAALARLSADPEYNATLRTTCVATMLTAGHAPNALPGRAEANVNCRILPGHSQEEVRQTLIRVFADPGLTVQYVADDGTVSAKGSDRHSATPPAPAPEIFDPLAATVNAIWPNTPILPKMELGASDSIYTLAEGIPSYGFNGMGIDRGDDRAHGRDERLGIESFYTGVEFEYLYLKALTGK